MAEDRTIIAIAATDKEVYGLCKEGNLFRMVVKTGFSDSHQGTAVWQLIISSIDEREEQN